MYDPNSTMLEDAAEKLGALVEIVVFVGGSTLGLLITDPTAAPIRPTLDVDVIIHALTYADYVLFSEQLRLRGFCEDERPNAPICRWRYDSLILDVMPLDEKVLGFSNRWYREAYRFSVIASLPNGSKIRTIDAPCFLATKFEAFRQRGQRDFYSSRDLEDIVSVIDGRESLFSEINAATPDLQEYLAEAMQELLKEAQFVEALPGYMLPDEVSPQRLPDLLAKLKFLSNGIVR